MKNVRRMYAVLSWRVNREGLERIERVWRFHSWCESFFPFIIFAKERKGKEICPLTGEKFNPLPPPPANHQGLERKSSSEFHSLVVKLCCT